MANPAGIFLRAKEEAIEADINVAKDDLEIYNRESNVSDRPLRSEGDEILSPTGRSDQLNETLLSLVMKDPIFLKMTSKYKFRTTDPIRLKRLLN